MRGANLCLLGGLLVLLLLMFAFALEVLDLDPAHAFTRPRRTIRLLDASIRAQHSSAAPVDRLTPVHRLDLVRFESSLQRTKRRVRLQGPPRRSFVVPIVYSDVDQGFVALLRVGNSNVYVVLDTGSTDLAVASSECIKQKLCSARDAGYDPRESPTARPVGTSRALSYGTLQIKAAKYVDNVALRALQRLDDCALTPPDVTDFGRTGEAFVAGVYVAAATEMRGTDSNILGLMAPQPGEQYPGFLHAAFEQMDVERRWGCALGTHGRGWFVLGAPPEDCLLQDPTYVPLSRDFRYAGAYVVDVEMMRAGDNEQSLQPLREFPRHVLLDTGTADTYVTSRYADAFEAAGLGGGRATLEIRLKGGVVLVYGPARQIARGVDTLQIGAEVVDRLFGGDAQVMLMGCHWMQGLSWDFCVGEGRVGIARYA